MSTTPTQGIFGFGCQPGSEVLPSTWYRHRATLFDLSIIDPVLQGPPEIGGKGVPTFPYKTGPTNAGGVSILPRLEDTLGWLLYALIGNVETTPVDGYAGAYDHEFALPDDISTLVWPWLACRKYIPPADGVTGSEMGEMMIDNKILSATFSLPNMAPISTRLDLLGRKGYPESPSGWTWTNDYEDWDSIPVGCVTGGYFKFNSETLQVAGGTVSFQNIPLDPRQERVFGSPYLLGVTPLQRAFNYDIVTLWQNPDLWTQLYTGAVDGSTWTATPFTASFEAKTISSVNMPSLEIPYSLTFKAENVSMSPVGGISMAANQAIMLRFAGTALDSDTGFASITLRNKVSSYVWPTSESSS